MNINDFAETKVAKQLLMEKELESYEFGKTINPLYFIENGGSWIVAW